MAEQPKLKAYVSKFTIRLGPISMVGRLISLPKPGQKKKKYPFVLSTPSGEPVQQRYISESDPSVLYTTEELHRAIKKEDGTLIPVETETIAETKKSELAKDVINLTVHDADAVNDSLFPADTNAYVFEPDFSDPVNIQWHALITALLAEHPEFAYVGICNLRNSEGLFRIVLWRNRLVVQRLMYPDEINDHGALEKNLQGAVDDAAVAKAVKMLTKLNTPFVADEYVDTTRENLLALTAAVAESSDGTVVTAKQESKGGGFDMMAALDSFD